MERRHLGKTGLEVGIVGMGTWRTFDVRGAKVERERAVLVARAVSAGVDLFDSSPMYGEAERVLGQALTAVRDRVMVATKVWSADDAVASRQIATALAFFGGRVDLYQVHNLVALPRRLEMLEELKREGLISAIGATHFSDTALVELQDVMKSGRIDAIQVPYNPIQRQVERAVLPLAADLGLGVLIMRPFGEGALLRRNPGAAELSPLAEFGVTTWPQALLKWVLSDSRCHVALPATSSVDHLQQNLSVASPPWFGDRERALVVRLAS